MPASRRVGAAPAQSRGNARDNGPRPCRLTLSNAAAALLATLPAVATAQSTGQCVSLKDSTTCPAFASASIATDQSLIDFYPFLRFVSDRASFDYQLSTYVQTSYIKDRYQGRFGCSDIDFTNSSDMYARYTKTVICNAIVQMSVEPCDLSEEASRPVCADTCAEFAQSEAYVTADGDLCSSPNDDLSSLIRADFTTCALPEKALTGSCIVGVDNEPDNCGFGNSTIGLCSYCSAGGTNSTDTCCYNSNAEKRCEGVKLPSITATLSLTTQTQTTSASSTPTNTKDADKDGDGGSGGGGGGGGGLSKGAIAGIVIGAIAGIAILAIALFFCIKRMKRSEGSQQGSIFNQPSPARRGAGMTQANQGAPQGYEVLPGGRIARMSALEGHSGGSPTNRHGSPGIPKGAGYVDGRRKGDTQSSSDDFGESSEAEHHGNILRPPPATTRRHGSLSSGSMLGSDPPQSPTSAGDFSSPRGMTSQQSEQLPFFKDYYSQDDIHPADKVSVLWAYQPRAADEFALERGDMLKVVGIWDDGWATGVMLDERSEEWEARRQAQRDSGVSNTSGARDNSPAAQGEMKAFPLVCVCLPEHWRKTIEGDGSTETESNGHNGHSTAS